MVFYENFRHCQVAADRLGLFEGHPFLLLLMTGALTLSGMMITWIMLCMSVERGLVVVWSLIWSLDVSVTSADARHVERAGQRTGMMSIGDCTCALSIVHYEEVMRGDEAAAWPVHPIVTVLAGHLSMLHKVYGGLQVKHCEVVHVQEKFGRATRVVWLGEHLMHSPCE